MHIMNERLKVEVVYVIAGYKVCQLFDGTWQKKRYQTGHRLVNFRTIRCHVWCLTSFFVFWHHTLRQKTCKLYVHNHLPSIGFIKSFKFKYSFNADRIQKEIENGKWLYIIFFSKKKSVKISWFFCSVIRTKYKILRTVTLSSEPKVEETNRLQILIYILI